MATKKKVSKKAKIRAKAIVKDVMTSASRLVPAAKRVKNLAQAPSLRSKTPKKASLKAMLAAGKKRPAAKRRKLGK